MPLPEVLYVPLVHHDGAPAEVCVRPGQHVRAGELIGRPVAPDAAAVHSPADGVAGTPTTADTPEHLDVPVVPIVTDRPGSPTEPPSDPAANPQPKQDGPREGGSAPEPCLDDLIERIAAAGIVEPLPAAPPTARRLAAAREHHVQHLIVNALQTEPYLTGRVRVLMEHGSEILVAATRLFRALGTRRVWLAVDKAQRELVRQLRRKAAGQPVRIAALSAMYPQDAAALLVRSLLGREVPCGRCELHAGALVIDVASLLAIERAVLRRAPLVSCIVTVAGDAAQQPGNYRIPIGMPFSHIVARVGLRETPTRIVAGGLMRGRAVERLDAVTTKRTEGVLLLTRRQVPRRRPVACVRCGWCIESCPVGLDPIRLAEAAELRRFDLAAALSAGACIECGLCTYVCPSLLALADAARLLKQKLADSERTTRPA